MKSLHSMSGNVYISNIREYLAKKALLTDTLGELVNGVSSYVLVFLGRF